MTYKEFKALSDAYWLGWDNAQGTLGKDDVSHRSFITLLQNVMMDEVKIKKGKRMSHYKEYKMGLIDEDEFRMACQMEFAGEDDDEEREEDE